MSYRRQILVALGLGLVGLLGIALIARGQMASNLAAAQQQYELKLKQIDRNKAGDLYNLAKWCYQNGLSGEALTLALEAHQKDPSDMRPKYLIYALTAPTEGEATGETGGDGGGPKVPTISAADVDAIYSEEGEDAMRKFREVQGILISRCGSPRCHGGNNEASKWALVTRSTADRQTIAENFRSVSKYIDREDPEKSRLLLMAMKGPEAGHPTQAIRGKTDPVYRAVVAWIKGLRTEAQKIWAREKSGATGPSPFGP